MADPTKNVGARAASTLRVEPLTAGSAAWYLRPFFWHQRRKYGAVLDGARLWARTPKVFVALALLYGMFDRRRSPIEPALRSLVTVRVSQVNGCRFCVDLNTATLIHRGVSPEKALAVANWRGGGRFTERERAALGLAEAMTITGTDVDDALVTELRTHFDDDALVELAGLVAFQNMSSKFNSAMGVPSQGFCGLPDVAPGDSGPSPGRGSKSLREG